MTKNYENSLHLLQESYLNVQKVIQFLDTKAGIVFTLVAAGLASAVFSENVESVGNNFNLLDVGNITGALSLILSLAVVWPTHGPKLPEQFTWLFPTLHPAAYKGCLAKSFKPEPLEALSTSEVANEYETQLRYLGGAMRRKICCLRGSIRFLGLTILFWVLHFISLKVNWM